MSGTRLASVLMWIAAAGAAVSAAIAFGEVARAGGETKMALTWQAYGLVVFAGLFALLARRPHGNRGVWELVIFHKVALTVTAAAYSGVDGTTGVILGDGIVSVLLVTAYVTCRGWARAARTARA